MDTELNEIETKAHQLAIELLGTLKQIVQIKQQSNDLEDVERENIKLAYKLERNTRIQRYKKA